MPTLAALNRMDRAAFVAALGHVYEHSPWVAERAWARRPFEDVGALARAMQAMVESAGREEQLALARAHPELAGREAAAGALTESSSSEQSRLGLTVLGREEFARISELNRRYREKHGFPCIVALALHASRESVLAEMERRIGNPTDAELAAALEQIGHIARTRLARLVTEARMGRLTTHVLDTASGRPAAGMRIELSILEAGRWRVLRTATTNADGRTDAPLAEGAAFVAGQYRLVFEVAAYFRAQGVALPEPPFLDRVPIRFGIADPQAHYHVPLLCTPWSYSTYRGS